MTRIIILIAIIAFPGLAMCAVPNDQHKTLAFFGFGRSSSWAADDLQSDPDGDGDTKGNGHFSMRRNATGNEVFIFDPTYNAWALYDEDGKCLNTGRASGGRYYCPDVKRRCKTISGKFRIISKGDSGCISSKYPLETHGGAPMPYCMYFSPKGYAIHGSNDVPDHNASHGCIRVTPTAAEWLNVKHMPIGTTVIVLPY
jgi:hypothetical protein